MLKRSHHPCFLLPAQRRAAMWGRGKITAFSMATFGFKLPLFHADAYTISVSIIFQLNTPCAMGSWCFNITSLVNETLVSFSKNNVCFRPGAEKSDWSTWEFIAKCCRKYYYGHILPFRKHPQTAWVYRAQLLKACVSNCWELNGSLKEWLIRSAASKLAQKANMNNTCLNKHL